MKYLKEIRTGSGSALSLASSDLTLTAGRGQRFNIGSVVEVNGDATPRTVTAIAGDVITLDDITALTVSGGEEVKPFATSCLSRHSPRGDDGPVLSLSKGQLQQQKWENLRQVTLA